MPLLYRYTVIDARRTLIISRVWKKTSQESTCSCSAATTCALIDMGFDAKTEISLYRLKERTDRERNRRRLRVCTFSLYMRGTQMMASKRDAFLEVLKNPANAESEGFAQQFYTSR